MEYASVYMYYLFVVCVLVEIMKEENKESGRGVMAIIAVMKITQSKTTRKNG